jgi:hypothetical protein
VFFAIVTRIPGVWKIGSEAGPTPSAGIRGPLKSTGRISALDIGSTLGPPKGSPQPIRPESNSAVLPEALPPSATRLRIPVSRKTPAAERRNQTASLFTT